MALGAFIVAVIQFIRLILEYIDRKTKQMQEKNVALKWLMCCVKTYVWLLEKIMQFINRYAALLGSILSCEWFCFVPVQRMFNCRRVLDSLALNYIVISLQCEALRTCYI